MLAHLAGKEHLDNPIDWVERALVRAGLPPLATIFDAAKAAMTAMSSQIIDGPYRPRLEALIAKGDHMFSKLGVIPTAEIFMTSVSEFALPPVHCADVNWVTSGQDADAVESWCLECIKLQNQIQEFLTACRL